MYIMLDYISLQTANAGQMLGHGHAFSLKEKMEKQLSQCMVLEMCAKRYVHYFTLKVCSSTSITLLC